MSHLHCRLSIGFAHFYLYEHTELYMPKSVFISTIESLFKIKKQAITLSAVEKVLGNKVPR